MIYFVPEGGECYSAIGLKGNRMGYFASRSAAFGRASAEVVISTFYNFSPAIIRKVIPAAWDLATPEAVLAARYQAVDQALRRGLGDAMVESAEVAEAAELARTAAEHARTQLYGRPLFAAHAALAWPDEPHLVLWHAQTLLREFRGDGHIAALLLAELDPVEALVMHAASGEANEQVLRLTRAWPDEDWDAAVGHLAERGLIDAHRNLTDDGLALRQKIEDQTDQLAADPYAALGAAGCERLRALARPVSLAVVSSGLLNVDPAAFEL
jgi:hypothetical protein